MGTRRLRKLVVAVGTSVAVLAGVGLAHAAPRGRATPAAGPTVLSGSFERSSVRLSWRTGSETTDVVERSLEPDRNFAALGPARRVRRAGAKASVRDNSVVAGTLYYYRVTGTTSAGAVYSNVLPVQVGVTPPTATTTSTTPVSGGAGGQPQWWKGFGAPSVDGGVGLGMDAAGEVTFDASISGAVDFGTGAIGSPGVVTSAIVHLAPNGTTRWARDVRAGITGLATDRRNGDIVVIGTFGGTIDFGGGPVSAHEAGLQDLFVARYSKDGALAWVRNFGPAGGWAIPNGVAIGPSGEILVTGQFHGSFDFGKGLITYGGAQRAPFLVSYSAAGAANWTKGFSPSADGAGLAVAVDPQGNVGVTGFFRGTLDLGGARLQSDGTEDIFIAEYSSVGSHTWSTRFGGADNERGTAVTFESNGALVGAGYFGGTVDFGGGPLTNPTLVNNYGTFPERDAFLVQFSGTGVHQWSKNFVPTDPNGNASQPQSLTVDGNGNIVLGGSIQNAVDFGGGPLAGNHTNDAFVAKFTAAGVHMWSHRWGAMWDDRVNGVATNAAGEVLAVGVFGQQIGPLTVHKTSDGRGVEDAFVVKLSS